MEEEAKSFLSSLVEKEYLLFIFLGVVLITPVALNGSNLTGQKIEIPIQGIIIFLTSSLIFFILGIYQLKHQSSNTDTSKKFDGQSGGGLFNNHQSLQAMVKSNHTAISSLLEAIKEIRSIASQERSFASNQIIQLIEDLNIAAIDYQEKTLDAELLAHWVRGKIEDWLKEIKIEDYPNVARNDDIKSFKQDLSIYLDLLCENIIVGLYMTPTSKNIQSNKDYVFAYKDALKRIRKTILSEIEADDYADLSIRQQEELLDTLDQLIEDIR